LASGLELTISTRFVAAEVQRGATRISVGTAVCFLRINRLRHFDPEIAARLPAPDVQIPTARFRKVEERTPLGAGFVPRRSDVRPDAISDDGRA
jgi:hypothetical protein